MRPGPGREDRAVNRILQADLENDPLLQQAAEWFFELRSDGVSGDRIAEWQQWLSSDQAHREAFQRVESFWRLCDGVAAPWPTEAEVQLDDYSGVESVTAWRARTKKAARQPSERRTLSRWRIWRFPPLTAASLGAVIVLMTVLYWPLINVTLQGGWRTSIRTGIGETRTVTMPDGSIISLGGETSLVATLLPHSRNVVLQRGEAYFKVTRETQRPFTVHAGSTTVTDIGTAFDVERVLGGIVVAVAEGVVQISTKVSSSSTVREGRGSGMISTPEMIQLKAGQRLALEPFNNVPAITGVNPTWVAGWRQGRLAYVDEPLAGVVADLSRYSARRIIVNDPGVANLRVTGIVFIDNVDNWLASLEATFPVRVARDDNGTVLIERRSP